MQSFKAVHFWPEGTLDHRQLWASCGHLPMTAYLRHTAYGIRHTAYGKRRCIHKLLKLATK